MTTSTYSGSFGILSTVKSYAVPSGAGTFTATLAYNGTSLFTMKLRNAAGTLLSAKTAASPIKITSTVAKGTYYLVITGRSASYTLTVTRPSP